MVLGAAHGKFLSGSFCSTNYYFFLSYNGSKTTNNAAPGQQDEGVNGMGTNGMSVLEHLPCARCELKGLLYFI
jgi:hypothetical protein